MKAQKKSALKDERLAEVYRTAAQIILRKGYDATSINDIANALGMTKAGLYHYINGKKELLFDIMNFGLDELEEEVVTPAQSIIDPAARLRFIIASHARLVTRGQGAITILGMINWLSRWFRQGGALTEEQVAEEIAKIALNGLLLPKSGTAQTRLRVVRD